MHIFIPPNLWPDRCLSFSTTLRVVTQIGKLWREKFRYLPRSHEVPWLDVLVLALIRSAFTNIDEKSLARSNGACVLFLVAHFIISETFLLHRKHLIRTYRRETIPAYTSSSPYLPTNHRTCQTPFTDPSHPRIRCCLV